MKTRLPRSLPWRLLPIIALAATIVAGAAWTWRALERRDQSLAWIPTPPALSDSAEAFRQRLTAATARAGNPFSAIDGLAMLSQLYHANGYFAESMQGYTGLRELDPGNARWPHLLANLLAGSGRLDEALPLWREVIRLAPDYAPARLRLGDILLKTNQVDEASRVYQDVLKIIPDQPYALLGLARARLAENDWNGARQHLLRAQGRHPDFVGTLTLLVTVHEHFSDLEAAKAVRAAIGMREFHDLRDPWLDELLDECYDPYRVSVGAAVAAYAGEPQTAVRLLERAITLAPTEGTYARQLGKLHYQLNSHTEARRSLEKAVALSPEDADAWSLLVDLLNTMGDAPAMQRALAKGLSHCPNSPSLRFANGSQLAKAGRTGEAIAELKRAQRLKPDEVRPFIELALIYFRQDRIEEGLSELRAALVAEPGHPLAMSVLARHAIETADEAQARHWLGLLRSQHRFSREDLATVVGEFRARFRREPW